MSKMKIKKKREDTLLYKSFTFFRMYGGIVIIPSVIVLIVAFALINIVGNFIETRKQHNLDVSNNVIQCDITCHKH